MIRRTAGSGRFPGGEDEVPPRLCDLDRPHRGLITISQKPMLELRFCIEDSISLLLEKVDRRGFVMAFNLFELRIFGGEEFDEAPLGVAPRATAVNSSRFLR